MKPNYIIYIWLAIFVSVFVWVLLFRGDDTDFARVEFGGVEMVIEYAMTSEERERGLGDREEISENFGMLFIFEEDDRYGFWMKEMQIPIDIFWLDEEMRVVSSAHKVSPDTYPTSFYPVVSARYALETASGFAERHAVATGTKLMFIKTPWFVE